MAFDSGIYEKPPEAGEIKGKQVDVAVLCWYTASGKAMPRLMKIMDEEGVCREIRDIRVLAAERKFYAGICIWEYRCRMIIENTERVWDLLFQPEKGQWKLRMENGTADMNRRNP